MSWDQVGDPKTLFVAVVVVVVVAVVVVAVVVVAEAF